MIWTVIAMGGDRHYQAKAYDWRPVGEFQKETGMSGPQQGKTAQQLCEEAARQLGLTTENYRCVRSK
jgi:hypothetical protein